MLSTEPALHSLPEAAAVAAAGRRCGKQLAFSDFNHRPQECQHASLLSMCACAWQMFRSGADFAAELTRGALDKGKELAQDWDLENKSRAVKGKLEQVFRGY